MNRRKFLHAVAGAGAAALGGACYGFFEAGSVVVDRRAIPLPRLPGSFRGTTVAFLTDIHHGAYTDLQYITSIVRTTNLLRPDLVVLGGDYSLRDAKYIGPCLEALADLRAPMGVYGVLGNHDYWHGIRQTKDGFRSAKVTELTNTGVWFERKGDRLRLAGVDDLWEGRPDVGAALGDATPADACVLVSHNPDLAEAIIDPAVGLVLSGHTHGGQVVFPGFGAPWAPSKYGRKYLRGLVEAPRTKVFVSRGLGLAAVPVRFNCRPEINLITLV
jgi:predicted MPP superfamily phosphohydrolase